MKCYLVHRRQKGVNSRVGVNQWSELIQHDSIELINTGYDFGICVFKRVMCVLSWGHRGVCLLKSVRVGVCPLVVCVGCVRPRDWARQRCGECLVRLLDFINTVDGANVFLEEGEPGIGDGFFRRELPTLPFECLVRFFLIFNHMYFVYNSYIGSAAASYCNQC